MIKNVCVIFIAYNNVNVIHKLNDNLFLMSIVQSIIIYIFLGMELILFSEPVLSVYVIFENSKHTMMQYEATGCQESPCSPTQPRGFKIT